MNQIFLNKETVLSSTSIRHLPLESMSFSGGKNKIIITGKNFEYILSILKERVIYNAKNKAKNALKRAGSRDTPKIILEILMDHDYRKSPKHFIPKPEFISKIKRQISDDKPVELVIPLFPCKVHNRLKAKGIYPDLSEILTILRLMEICLAIKEVYNPGGHFLIAADGFRFKKSWRVSSEDIKNYQDRIKEFINLTGANKYMELVDYEKFINENYSKEEKLQRNFNYLKAVSKYRSFSQQILKTHLICLTMQRFTIRISITATLKADLCHFSDRQCILSAFRNYLEIYLIATLNIYFRIFTILKTKTMERLEKKFLRLHLNLPLII